MKGEFFLDPYKQNGKLSIRLVAPDFGHLDPAIAAGYNFTQRRTHYFFLLMLEGSAQHNVDLQRYEIQSDELLFILPHQMHQLPGEGHGGDYYKIGFDEHCLYLLPRTFPFLINPFNRQKIAFSAAAVNRLRSTVAVLRSLLSEMDTEPELILAHLNSLLTEINLAYFAADKNPADGKLSKYIDFKLFIEKQLTEQPSIETIAEALAVNTNGLYQLVKHYSGLSPKTFITHRLILEAKRRLYYGEHTSVKTLAFALGFNDPDYFSRLFKKETGGSVAQFLQELR
jgi:AraC family transcriptional activator of pobA